MAVRRSGEPLTVTPTEFRILHMLMRGAGRIATREMLLRCIWDDEGLFIDDNTLSVHISRCARQDWRRVIYAQCGELDINGWIDV